MLYDENHTLLLCKQNEAPRKRGFLLRMIERSLLPRVHSENKKERSELILNLTLPLKGSPQVIPMPNCFLKPF